jgi:hypothetical protein
MQQTVVFTSKKLDELHFIVNSFEMYFCDIFTHHCLFVGKKSTVCLESSSLFLNIYCSHYQYHFNRSRLCIEEQAKIAELKSVVIWPTISE